MKDAIELGLLLSDAIAEQQLHLRSDDWQPPAPRRQARAHPVMRAGAILEPYVRALDPESRGTQKRGR